MARSWSVNALQFLRSVQDSGFAVARSSPDGPITLYGTCYAQLARYYLGESDVLPNETIRFVSAWQNPQSGLFEGLELVGFEPAPGSVHSKEHLLLHQTCTVLALCQQYSVPLSYPVFAAHQFCDQKKLVSWLENRDFKDAWLEGNNILFVGQLLVYLRDVEKYPGAQDALTSWFAYLDRKVDLTTGLWGTDGLCTQANAVYGGYHQLLVYFYENQPVPNARGLVDTVLSIQHADGGFNPAGNAGACEDVDAVDILVNCYKRFDYRRSDIRVALRRCVGHILTTQNPDGGFPYNRDQMQSHMGIPGTVALPNVSCVFPTWFRIHTLALIAEVLPNQRALAGITFRFNKALGMGWHASPTEWHVINDEPTVGERLLLACARSYFTCHVIRNQVYGATQYLIRILRKVTTRLVSILAMPRK